MVADKIVVSKPATKPYQLRHIIPDCSRVNTREYP
jgi:hypothetical protein